MQAKKPTPAMRLDLFALPAGVPQRIFCLASTCQVPGSCLAAGVCRTWRAAAAGCRGIRLLYHTGRPSADKALCNWLRWNSRQLGAITLSSYNDSSKRVQLVLQALAGAAEDAQEEGRPLPLHTLRVLGPGPNMATTGRLLAALPRLHTLQLAPEVQGNMELVLECLAPLGQAMQLQRLYLARPATALPQDISASMAQLLPLGLNRLSWEASGGSSPVPDLSHLTQLTFLQLRGGWRPSEDSGKHGSKLDSAVLPPGVQELDLIHTAALPEVLQERPQLLTEWNTYSSADLRRHLSRLTHLRKTSLGTGQLQAPAVRTALAQHATLSALKVHAAGSSLGAVASIRNLRCLELSLERISRAEAAALSALTGVTRLTALLVSGGYAHPYQPLVNGIGGMTGLRWLSTSALVLHTGRAWLGCLQQLRVLSLFGVTTNISGALAQWLEGWVQQGLPPQLQVLGLRGMDAKQATAWRLRHRVQGLLSGTGCELVVGIDLDEVCDPTQQLAGLPWALQQALM